MGKASSAKKVARAARAGGRRSAGARQRNLLFPAVIGAIVIVGTGLVTVAANDRKTDTSVPPVAFQDHWHAAYGIYVCDEFLPALLEFHNPEGVHTHGSGDGGGGDGVIHIHPNSENGAGENATLGLFLRDSGVELSDDELTVGDQTWTEGDDQCGDQDGELVVAQWLDVQATDDEPALFDEDFGDLRFRGDGEGYVIAFVPEGTDIPKPGAASNLAELGAADQGAEATTTTAPGEGGEPSDTTGAPGDETTTTVADTTPPEG